MDLIPYVTNTIRQYYNKAEIYNKCKFMGLFNFSGKKEYEEEMRDILTKIEKQLKQNDYFSVSFSYQMLAKLAEEQGDIATAIKYIELAAEYSLKDNKLYTAGWHYKTLAALYFKRKEYTKAIEFSVKSADLLIQTNSRYAAQWSYNLAAKASEEKGDVYTAIRYYRKSLELGEDQQIKEEINRLKRKVPKPTILEFVNKKEAKEGEAIEFKIIVENSGLEPLKNVRLLDKYDRLINDFYDLAPYEGKYFSFKTTGRVGLVKPAYKKIVWENIIGDSFEEPIEQIDVKVEPKVEVIVSCNPSLRLNKSSTFMILIRNLSSTTIKNVNFFSTFPDSLSVKEVTKNKIERIGPDEERGVAFSITPHTVGESRITNIKVSYNDEFGIKHESVYGSCVLREAVEEEKTKKTRAEIVESLGKTGLEYLKSIENKKKETTINPHPISQEEYVRLTTSYHSLEKGYTLKDISIEVLSSHILDACESMALISSHKFEKERLFLFSGENFDTIYLLTIAVKQLDGDIINVLFKAYSNQKGLGKFLDNISDIIEYTSMVMSSAKEIEKVEVKQIIKIIDSIVQRSQIGAVSTKNKELTIKDSVVQRSNEV